MLFACNLWSGVELSTCHLLNDSFHYGYVQREHKSKNIKGEGL